MSQPRYKTVHLTAARITGLHRRLVERNQNEIDAARAAGDYQRAELLTLRSYDYPAYVAELQRRRARDHAASVAGLPIDQRPSVAA